MRGELEQHQVVVYESGRRWFDHVRARASTLSVRARHATHADDCLESLRSASRTTLLLELGADPLAALDLLLKARDRATPPTVLVVADGSQAALELPARELGAAAFLRRPVAPRDVAAFVEKVLRLSLGVGRSGSKEPQDRGATYT